MENGRKSQKRECTTGIKQLITSDLLLFWLNNLNTMMKNMIGSLQRIWKRMMPQHMWNNIKKRWGIETIYRVTDNITILTTSTKGIIRYFLFVFTCLVYNIWRFFQLFLGEEFTLANHKTNMIIFMAKHGMIYPKHYERFELIAKRWFNVG